ncbi:hypothetical protein OSB04_015848 [Centaurea solstitialis]|uniref:Uncharacterized protein n=1 Tax=Centaurea solstitialis TaxID=347529 RepID=A0AA38SZY1_9ASTR|nr:hypothetical protein OSB04_015848 [Centaurea solstitialis]
MEEERKKKAVLRRMEEERKKKGVMIWWWVRRPLIRHAKGEARHGQDIVVTLSIVTSNVVNGKGLNMELVTVKGWGWHAFATSIVESYESINERRRL